ncbi:DgyrCDS9384 [Dimorphilus gyrociliatus]|uniref:DgyrCDS9384 n=1 Tax=Dimorphilus gyrociliatus TaxID=2664684 RepID=A0A7I8VX71_9ANNE|nr:DgyrCDS9384 [Dimorphilus gyrociliatus]
MYGPITTSRKPSMQATGVTPHDLGLGDAVRKEPYADGALKLLETITLATDAMCVQFNRDASILAVGLANGTIQIYSADDYRHLYSLSDSDVQKSRLPATTLRFSQTENTLTATYASGLIKFWHITNGQTLHTINEGEKRQTLASAFNNDASSFISAGSDSKIVQYDGKTKQVKNVLQATDSRDVMNGHRMRIFALQYHPDDPHVFVSGGWDDTVHFWDDRTTHSVRKLYGPHICGDALDIDPIHNHILSGSWRKNNVLQVKALLQGD